MKFIKYLIPLTLFIFSPHLLAYGGGSSSQKCKPPTFNNFNPEHLSTVAPQSEFSFKTSALTSPSSINVTVKKQPVTVTTEKILSGYLITGQLPNNLSNTFARINIVAKGTNKCVGNAGWLVKINSD